MFINHSSRSSSEAYRRAREDRSFSHRFYNTVTGVKTEEVKCSVVSTSGTSEEWAYFARRGSECKKPLDSLAKTSSSISSSVAMIPFVRTLPGVST
ncbi:hypothetical protein ElyMa_001966100 [Elysia marginata]|uniref:Uncharacterized protein n=1 Tax=Elysia marginata TaxID=1093978 RepID=A0AAV4F1H9_9GAST|nr:hypothetical protein ElyMa_001966100 [Elysia marginata]